MRADVRSDSDVDPVNPGGTAGTWHELAVPRQHGQAVRIHIKQASDRRKSGHGVDDAADTNRDVSAGPAVFSSQAPSPESVVFKVSVRGAGRGSGREQAPSSVTLTLPMGPGVAIGLRDALDEAGVPPQRASSLVELDLWVPDVVLGRGAAPSAMMAAVKSLRVG